MPPRKKAKTTVQKEKPEKSAFTTDASFSTQTNQIKQASGFFQDQARAERRLRRERLREDREAQVKQQEKSITKIAVKRFRGIQRTSPIESGVAIIRSTSIEAENTQEKLTAIKVDLKKRKKELEQQILVLITKRSNKKESGLVKLDIQILELIWQWKLVRNQHNSWDKRTGMILAHQQIVRDIVTANGMVSWYRPFNLEAESWLLKGAQGKALLTKGKSSGFDYIAGLIPVDVRLSKLMRNQVEFHPHDIAYYQSNMDFVMEMYDTRKISKAEIERAYHDYHLVKKIEQARTAVTALEEKANQSVDFSQLAQYRQYIEIANELPKQIAVTQAFQFSDGQECLVYYLVNQYTQVQDQARSANELHRDDVIFQDNQPIFFIERDARYLVYNTKTHSFDIPCEMNKLPKKFNKQPLRVMAYQQFELDGDRYIRLKNPRLVTADYDEGSSAALRVHPFMQRTEIATDSFSILQLTRPSEIPQEAIDQFTVGALLSHEIYRNIEARDVATYGTMGKANDAQRAMIGYLRDETGWTVNHGPEANSPTPQKFEAQAIYPCFYSDGRVELLEGDEGDICEFINKQRALGFPLAVNPKWDWVKDQETGQFSIPTQIDRFDWEPVDQFLKENQLKADAIDQKYRQRGEKEYETFLTFNLEEISVLAQEEENLSELNRDRLLIVTQNLAAEIAAIMLKIETLRIEPDLIYPGLIESYQYRILSREDKELYQQRIQQLIEQFHVASETIDTVEDSNIGQILGYYDVMEKELRELEHTTPEYQIRQKYDEIVKQKVNENRHQMMYQLFQRLQNKREKYREINQNEYVLDLLNLTEKKVEELRKLFESLCFFSFDLQMRG